MSDFIFGKSRIMSDLQTVVKKVAASELPIYLEGETGTGKSLLAREIHNLSAFNNGLFVSLDCASISPTLIESELFGHEKGAFTGATETKSGLFEMACGGTVFLDEIENVDLSFQAKLLRVIEEKKFRHIGGVKEIEVFFRIITASNAPIEQKIKQKLFRKDLYYRLKGTKLLLPPLRERRSDIASLATHYLHKYNFSYGCKKRFSKDVMSHIENYSWGGNVRELIYTIEEAAIKANDEIIYLEDFSLDYQKDLIISSSRQNQYSLEEMEKKYIEVILKSVTYNKTRAAKIMGIGLNTLYRKISKYEILLEEVI